MSRTIGGRSAGLALAAVAGAVLMYLLDPRQGRRRVALMRDSAVHVARKGRDLTGTVARDLAHRATGIAAALRGPLRRKPADNRVLVERVRARMGRWTSHPHAIKVSASNGFVTLSGTVLHSEHDRLLREVAKVRGVRQVENRLEAHESAGRVPSLQGGRGRSGTRMEMMQRHWSAGPRLLFAAGGAALALYGLRQRGVGGALVAIAGAGLTARAVTNMELRQALGVSGGHRATDIEKTIHIAAPRETVFDTWSHCENFSHFMSNVEEVRALDERRSHWVVKGPAGSHVEWDAVITEHLRPELLAWRSEPGAPVQHAGTVRFEEKGDGTRISVRMSYSPPGGAVGHAIAKLLGRDPRHEMDADLMRMKAFIESRQPAHDSAHPDEPIVGQPSPSRLGVQAFP